MAKHALLFSVSLISCLLACLSLVLAEQMVSVGSHRLQIHSEGTGSPTVVIDAGLGDRIDRLRLFQESLARTTRVITYNRAGYGQSEPGPLPRDCGREARELKAVLDNASVPSPYLLVGHSLGALNIQVFAERYPETVTGIVLLDPPPLSFILKDEYISLLALADEMTAQWQATADAGSKSADAEERAQAAFFAMIASEHREMFGTSAQMVSGIASFGDIPLVVIAAGKPNPVFGEIADEYQKYWIEQSRGLSEKSTRGSFILAEESSHHLYLDVPDLVRDAIVSLVDQARGK